MSESAPRISEKAELVKKLARAMQAVGDTPEWDELTPVERAIELERADRGLTAILPLLCGEAVTQADRLRAPLSGELVEEREEKKQRGERAPEAWPWSQYDTFQVLYCPNHGIQLGPKDTLQCGRDVHLQHGPVVPCLETLELVPVIPSSVAKARLAKAEQELERVRSAKDGAELVAQGACEELERAEAKLSQVREEVGKELRAALSVGGEAMPQINLCKRLNAILDSSPSLSGETRGSSGLNALAEIATRVGRVSLYLSRDRVGKVEIAKALDDARDAAEFFNTVRAALHGRSTSDYNEQVTHLLHEWAGLADDLEGFPKQLAEDARNLLAAEDPDRLQAILDSAPSLSGGGESSGVTLWGSTRSWPDGRTAFLSGEGEVDPCSACMAGEERVEEALLAIAPGDTVNRIRHAQDEETLDEAVTDLLRIAAPFLRGTTNTSLSGDADLLGKARAALRDFDDHGDYEAPVQALRDYLRNRLSPENRESNGLNALGEIATRVGRIRMYLDPKFASGVEVENARIDADNASEFFDTVRAALRGLSPENSSGVEEAVARLRAEADRLWDKATALYEKHQDRRANAIQEKCNSFREAADFLTQPVSPQPDPTTRLSAADGTPYCDGSGDHIATPCPNCQPQDEEER